MIDKTSRDIRLGDLSAVDATGAREPNLGEGHADAVADTTGVVRRRSSATVSTNRSDPGAAHPPAGFALSWPVVAMALLVIVLLGGVILLLLEQRSLGAQLAVLQAEARKSVETLESRVATTNTTLKSTDSETQRSLDIIATNISKLDRSLAKVGQALEQESKTRAAQDGELKTFVLEVQKALQADMQAAAQADTRFETRLKTLADSLDQANAKLKTQADAVARLERSNEAAQLRSEVAVLGASVRQLQDDHEKRLKAIEQVSGSNDAFRRQVNATIDRLNQQVSELYQRR